MIARRRLAKLWLGVALAAALPPRAEAALEAGAGLSDGMVLQREAVLPIRGRDLPGAAVRLSFRGKTLTTTADASGEWRIELPPQAAGGPHELVLEGSTRVVLGDVFVGDVWVCSGQSNMEMALSVAENGRAEARAFRQSALRLLRVPRLAAEVAPAKLEVAWEVAWQAATPDSAGRFSAVCALFGRGLQESLQVPIGLINASVGGSAGTAAGRASGRRSRRWPTRCRRCRW